MADTSCEVSAIVMSAQVALDQRGCRDEPTPGDGLEAKSDRSGPAVAHEHG